MRADKRALIRSGKDGTAADLPCGRDRRESSEGGRPRTGSFSQLAADPATAFVLNASLTAARPTDSASPPAEVREGGGRYGDQRRADHRHQHHRPGDPSPDRYPVDDHQHRPRHRVRADGIDGAAGTTWTIANSGTVISAAAYSVQLAGPGDVTNYGLISGREGVGLLAGGSVTIEAGGSIAGTGTLGGGPSTGAGIFITGAVAASPMPAQSATWPMVSHWDTAARSPTPAPSSAPRTA